MIVVEDIEANEIRRFMVIDAAIQLGIVRAGTYIRTFDPDRIYSFYNMVENQLYDFASSYPGAFKYLPRRSYDYLKKPRLLDEFSQGASELSQLSWLADLFVVQPLIDLGNAMLPSAQQTANTDSTYRWATLPPTSPRFYHLQDMRLDRRTPTGWGCILRSEDLLQSLKGLNRTDILDYVKSSRPIFVELDSPNSLDPLVDWLIILKEAGLKTPKLVLKARSQKDWKKDITRLLDIPDSRLLTAGATISSLSTIIRYLKREQNDVFWSKRLMFASSYPETQIGDSVSEIISFLLSRNLSATSEDVQRVLGGNMLALLPPRPPFMVYTENNVSVMAEENLGKSAMNELVRILQLLNARNILHIVSVDHMIDDEGGLVHLDNAVLTVSEPSGEKATSLSILVEKNGVVMVSGWKKAFTDSMTKRDGMLLQTLIRANAKLDGPIFGSPAHLVRFDQTLLSCLQVENPKDIMSALHFGIEIAKIDSGTFLMAPSDMDALDVSSDDFVLALETRTGQWCAGQIKKHVKCNERSIVISEKDASLYGFRNSSVVNIVKLEDEIGKLSRVVLSYSSSKFPVNTELLSYIHLHENEILDSIRGMLVGFGSKLFIGPEKTPITLNIAQTKPELMSGQIGRIPDNEIFLRPLQAFQELNIVLCISTGNDMRKRDIPLKTLSTIIRNLDPLSQKVDDLKEYLYGLRSGVSRADIAALVALLIMNMMNHNQTEGKLGLVTFAEDLEKFSVQHGEEVRQYIEFANDLPSEEVVVSLIYSILDTIKETGGREDVSCAFRGIAEFLEDFGPERPTLVVVIGGSAGKYDEQHLAFTQAIAKHERYQIELLVMENKENHRSALRLLKGINARILPIDTFSSQLFLGHLLDVIDTLIPISTRFQSDA
ncbi:MAG: hypothetical protein JW779_04520 [Candidatus Thorarchaeota archaeon]|nr:hypothetical protein [Candidatus Thorarchaeota archaeon]